MLALPNLNLTSEKLYCRVNRPLYVILSSDQQARYFLGNFGSELSLAHWLIFLRDDDDVEEFFADIDVPFDCEFVVAQRRGDHVVLTEVYRVRRDLPLKRVVMGTWTPTKRLELPTSKDLCTRRNNLDGIVLTAGVKNDPPFIRIYKINNDTIRANGIMGILWAHLEDQMNFTTKFVQSPGNAWGSRLANGSWTGLMKLVIDKEIDVAVNLLSMTLLRREVTQFSSITHSKLQVYIRRPTTLQLVWSNFLAPFSPTLWLATVLLVVFVSGMLTLVYRVARRYGQEDVGTAPYDVGDSLLCILGFLCQQGVDAPPRSLSCRIILCFAAVASIIIFAAYAAELISSLTAQIVPLPFESLEGLLKDGSYKVGVLANSGHSNILDSSNDALLSEIYDKLVKSHAAGFPKTVEEGMGHVCRKAKYGFFTSENLVLAMADSLECEVIALPYAKIPINSGIILPKKSPYRNNIDRLLLMFRNYGIINREHHSLLPDLPELTQSPLYSVTLWQLIPIFTIVVAGVASAATFLLVELSVGRRWGRRRGSMQQTKNPCQKSQKEMLASIALNE